MPGWAFAANFTEFASTSWAWFAIPAFILFGLFISWKYFAKSRSKTAIDMGPAHDNYEILLQGSGIGVYEWHDLQNFQKPMFWSTRMYELLGFTPDSFEPTAEFYFSLIHDADRDRVQQVYQSLLIEDSVNAIDCRFRVLTDFRWFRVRPIAKRAENGDLQFIIGSIENIHEQKIADEKIRKMNLVLEDEIARRTRQLENANQAKTRFLANMAHEIRTPVSLILGFADVLNENQELKGDAKEYVLLIQKNGQILSRVINDLLDLSKIEAGKMSFQYSKVKLKNLMEDLEKSFAEQTDKKSVQLFFQNLCSDDEVVATDEIRLKQVVYNLLSNALKFTEKGSIHITIGKQEGKYYLDVVDTGHGIPDSEKEHIFNEYSRREVAEAGNAIGNGLGLQLAKNLAMGLGGNVELVSSQIEKGSHFRLTFQSDIQKLQKQVKRRQEAQVSSQLNSFDIFVLDDNEDNIRLAEIFLKRLGCRVRGFTSAKSLFAEMTSLTPDLILLDIHMPEMNGFQVFDHLRKIGFDNPIWALTAYSLNEDVEKILSHGFDDYIRKPISLDGMKRKLTFELRGRMND